MWMPLLALTALALMPAAYGQEICTTTSKPVLDLVFVVDSSGSINVVQDCPASEEQIQQMISFGIALPPGCDRGDDFIDNYQYMKNFIKDILKDMTIGQDNVRVGLVLFSSQVQNTFFLNTFSTKEEVLEAVENLPYLGYSTSTRLALEEAHHVQLTEENGDRPEVPDLVVLLTDGESNFESKADIEEVIRIAEHMHEDGVNIITVGVTDAVNVEEITGVSSPDHIKDENWFFAKDFASLDGMVPQIVTETCEILPTEPPTEPPTAPPTDPPTEPPIPTETPIVLDDCIPLTKVFGNNIKFTLQDGKNYQTVPSREDCLDLCDMYDNCASIEFNIGYSKCQINKKLIENDPTGQHERWEYCPRRSPMPVN